MKNTQKQETMVAVSPNKQLRLLSQVEMAELRDSSSLRSDLLRRCALAILNTGAENTLSSKNLDDYRDFRIEIKQEEKGLKLLLFNPPSYTFVDGKLIDGIKENLFSVIRDISFAKLQPRSRKTDGNLLTDEVFQILRNAGLLIPDKKPNLAVCWGGHSINQSEYLFTKEVGYEMGLRSIETITGCGPGAMKGPMKGSAVGHAKQHFQNCRYIGLTEPGIISAEPPNPIVNELVVLPDIEKRLEAFLRLGHGFVVFPGGVGTLEEILYVLSVLLHPKNEDIPFPLVFAADNESAPYFKMIQNFLITVFGKSICSKFEVVINNPEQTARKIKSGINKVERYRKKHKDAFYFNWLLYIDPDLQKPFHANHRNMSEIKLNLQVPPYELASNLRKIFSGIVAGNVKPEGIAAVAAKGPFRISGSNEILLALENILETFIKQNRMSIDEENYKPCYRLIKE